MNKKLPLNQIRGLSIDQIINLYKHGYRLETNNAQSNAKIGNNAENITGDTKNKTPDISSIMTTAKIDDLYKLGYKGLYENQSNQEILTQIKDLPIFELIRLGYRITILSPDNDPIVDPFVNFGKVTVSTGYDDVATTISLATGNGSALPDPSLDGAFNLIWWNSTDYSDPTDDPDKEIVRITGRSGDTLTVIRAQEGTTSSIKNLPGKVYQMINALTVKTIQDLQNVPSKSLQTSTGTVNISLASAPLTGQILTATSPTSAGWQNLAAPQCFFATLVASPTFGTFPLTVNYNATVIGGEAPYTYSWNFGDGGTSTSPTPNHTFTTNGTFTTRLTIIDSLGSSSSSATVITVSTGIALVANGLGMSESLAPSDMITGFYNASANQGSIWQDSIVLGDSITGLYNSSAGQNSPFQDSVIMADSLIGVYNASADGSSPFLENVAPNETLVFISSITLLSTASMTRNSTIILTPTCYFYGTGTSCPGLNWSSSNTNVATVSSTGVVTSSTTNTGTTNITASSSGVVSNICIVTVTT